MSAAAPAKRGPVPARRETRAEAETAGGAEIETREADLASACASGDTQAFAHATLALAIAQHDHERGAHHWVPAPELVEPAPAPRPLRRDRRPSGGRPRARRVASRSAGGGSSGDDGEPGEGEPPLAAATTTRAAR